jgi:hypothetical protein
MNLKEDGAKRAAIPEKEVVPEEGVVFLIVLVKSVTCQSEKQADMRRRIERDSV